MKYPFYGSYSYPAREVPFSCRETKPARKVIHVPVTDGSEKRSRSRADSAVKIQKVFRGFMVRKSVKKIAAIKAEVDEMEKLIMSEGTVELIKKDRKERLKFNEMLMRLLLKLDSVPGVDFGVRDCRKAVIRKAIRLQEVVDSIADESTNRISDSSESDRNRNSNVDQKMELLNCNESPEIYESGARDVPEAMDVEPRRTVEEENAPEIEVNVPKSASELTSNSNPPADQNRELQPEAPENEGDVAKSASELNLNSNLENDSVNKKHQLQNNVIVSEMNIASEAGDIPEAMDVETQRTLEQENTPEFEVNVVKSASELTSISNSPENNADQNRGIPSDAADVHVAIYASELNSNSNSPENNAHHNSDFPSEAHEVDFAKSIPKSTSNPNPPGTDADRSLKLQYTVDSQPDAAKSELPAAKTEPTFNEYAESMDLSQDESQTGSSADPDGHEEESDSETFEKPENGDGIERDEAKGGDAGKNIQLLEKLVEDNKKMMGLMADLFKKNEMQTLLLSSLSHRVEHLEKALMGERFRRKKKKN